MKFRAEFKYGLFIAGGLLIWLIMEYIAGYHTDKIAYQPYVTNLFFVIMLVIMFKAMYDKRVSMSEGMTFMDGLKYGMVISFYGGSLCMLSEFVFIQFINPDFFQSMTDYAIEVRTQQGMSEAEAVSRAQAYYNLRSFILTRFMSTMGFGFLITLIASALMKNKSSVPS